MVLWARHVDLQINFGLDYGAKHDSIALQS